MKSLFAIAVLSLTSTPTLAQSYYPPNYYGGGGASSPVVVPPTIINTQQRMENESKKSCNESEIDLFLFAIRRTKGDCTQ
tara:strand:- start:111 stop:350 length:240 start_codon:yes stop_codon:yes gene_type:complete